MSSAVALATGGYVSNGPSAVPLSTAGYIDLLQLLQFPWIYKNLSVRLSEDGTAVVVVTEEGRRTIRIESDVDYNIDIEEC